jgi:hypothetical protein
MGRMPFDRSCGCRSWVRQYERPVWGPLVEVVGEELAGTFMWMNEEELEDGVVLQAYKHIDTRRYLYLSEGGYAYEYAACGGLVPVRLDFAVQDVLCLWSILHGWDADVAESVRAAVERAGAIAGERGDTLLGAAVRRAPPQSATASEVWDDGGAS